MIEPFDPTDPDQVASCSVRINDKPCGGERQFIGQTGNLYYFRCLACGMLSEQRVKIQKKKGWQK